MVYPDLDMNRKGNELSRKGQETWCPDWTWAQDMNLCCRDSRIKVLLSWSVFRQILRRSRYGFVVYRY